MFVCMFLLGVLLAYISAGLGDSLTPKMETVWVKFLDTMVNVVNEEMDHLAKGISFTTKTLCLIPF